MTPMPLLAVLTLAFVATACSHLPQQSTQPPQALRSSQWQLPQPTLQPVSALPSSHNEQRQSDKIAAWRATNVSVDAKNVPLDELLYALAEQAKVPLEMGAETDAVVTASYAKSAFDTVLARLALRHGFQYRWRNDGVYISDDSPYFETYTLPALGASRRYGSSMAVGGGTLGLASNGDSALSTEAEHDPWSSAHDAVSSMVAGKSVLAQPEAGLMVVEGSVREHDAVSRYLSQLTQRLRRQVLVEAVIVEVTMDEGVSTGVDWRSIASGDGWSVAQAFGGSSVQQLTAPGAALAYTSVNGARALSAALSALESFGSVQVVANPRLHVMHQQPAALRVVDEHVYFEHSLDENTNTDGDVTGRKLSTEVRRVPVGLSMAVLAAVDDNHDVVLQLRPTLSRIRRYVDVPQLLDNPAPNNQVPELQVRELETVVTIPSGALVLLGGLVATQNSDERNGLPGTSDIPLLGSLLGSRDRKRQRTDIGIFLRPTVIGAAAR